MEEKPEWWASPATIGLMGFGTTTMLAGFANLPNGYAADYGNWTVFGMALFFGGIAQLISGFIALRKGNMFAGSAFVGYGAFWLAYVFLVTSTPSAIGGPLGAGAGLNLYGVAGFAAIWGMFTFTFLINSPKHGWGIFGVFLLLFIAYILLAAKFFTLGGGHALSTDENWAVGGEIFLTGALAWYVATADLTNWNYGRKVLPV
jgi:uncharacterized protein